MYYKIQKSLGHASAVLVDSVPTEGVCIEFKQFFKPEASIIVYQNGKPEDICINGWTFPCVFNDLKIYNCSDIFGGTSRHEISFSALDPFGSVQDIKRRQIYGDKESLAVEYFYSMIYNLSCCKDTAQFDQLYTYVINNNDILQLSENLKKDTSGVVSVYKGDREKVGGALHFIDSFRRQIETIRETDYLPGLKQKIDLTYRAVLSIVANPAFNKA